MQKKGFSNINRDTLILTAMNFQLSRAPWKILKGWEIWQYAWLFKSFASRHSEADDLDNQIKSLKIQWFSSELIHNLLFQILLVHSSLNYVKMPLNAVEIIIKASAFLFLCCLWPTEMIQETTEKSVIFISVTIHQSESSQYIHIMWPICFSLWWCGQDFVCRLHLQQVETCKKKF